jgi:hypothetical protein
MGVDFLSCSTCSAGFPDCSYDCCYCSCGECFCSDECAMLDDSNEDVEDDETTCCICRGEHCTDRLLINFLLKRFNLTEEQAIDLYKKEYNYEK